MVLKPLKKALAIKPTRTRSCTELSCSEATNNLGFNDAAEPKKKVVLNETCGITGFNTNILKNCILTLTEECSESIISK